MSRQTIESDVIELKAWKREHEAKSDGILERLDIADKRLEADVANLAHVVTEQSAAINRLVGAMRLAMWLAPILVAMTGIVAGVIARHW